VLERPLNEVLHLQKPDFPFCLCWANENWTRTWDGKDKDVLLKQDYNEADDKQHMLYLCQVFEDKRYIRIADKPLFIIYRSELFPDIKRTLQIWREEAHKQGIGEIYLARMESFTSENPQELGFDAAIEFQPDWRNLPSRKKATLQQKIKYKLQHNTNPYTSNRIFEYRDFIDTMLSKPKPAYKRFPCVVPSWDNSARRQKNAFILDNASPQLYEEWLTNVVSNFKPYSVEENMVFINAWNEWAEGNHLEPCQMWGKAYLEATLRALNHA
jgi:lipopolysaccharide biosynthesis protein